ncbi:hypothetical protein [Comamonas odontotermitis]|uniref:hypothetical protein n=1 Tax=Comamonas odontotermitis TaxID=379895 RepID=UPI003753139B
MTHGRKPRKPRLVRNPLTHANEHVSGLRPHELSNVQRTLDDCLAALRHVRYEREHIQALNTFWQISQEIERSGIVKGFTEQINAAQQAATAIFNRCETPSGWHAKPLRGPELAALDDMAYYYMFQIRNVTYGELHRLQNKVIHRAKSMGHGTEHIKAEQLHVDLVD